MLANTARHARKTDIFHVQSAEHGRGGGRGVQQIVPGLEDSPYHPTLDFPITNDPLNDSVLRRRRLKEKLFPDLLDLELELQNSRASRASRDYGVPLVSAIPSPA